MKLGNEQHAALEGSENMINGRKIEESVWYQGRLQSQEQRGKQRGDLSLRARSCFFLKLVCNFRSPSFPVSPPNIARKFTVTLIQHPPKIKKSTDKQFLLVCTSPPCGHLPEVISPTSTNFVSSGTRAAPFRIRAGGGRGEKGGRPVPPGRQPLQKTPHKRQK